MRLHILWRWTALTLLAASAATAADKDPLAGRVAGKPQNCINPQFAEGPQIVDDHTILYRVGRRIYRTGPVGTCTPLRPQTTLVTEIYGGQLCHNDHFRVLAPGERIPGPVCRFSTFTPYEAPHR